MCFLSDDSVGDRYCPAKNIHVAVHSVLIAPVVIFIVIATPVDVMKEQAYISSGSGPTEFTGGPRQAQSILYRHKDQDRAKTGQNHHVYKNGELYAFFVT